MKVSPPPLSPSLGRREPAVYMKAPCKVGVMMGQRACHKTRGLSTPITFTHITNTKTLRIQSARDGKSNTTQHWVVLLVGLSYMPVCSFVLFSRSVFPRDTNCRRDRFHQQWGCWSRNERSKQGQQQRSQRAGHLVLCESLPRKCMLSNNNKSRWT